MSFNHNQGYGNPYTRNNFGMPNYFQPQYAQYPQMAQQTQQPMPSQQPQQQIQCDAPIQYVGYATLKEAEAYIIMPNSMAIFIDKANDMYYEKICNSNGQSFIKKFRNVAEETPKSANETPKEESTIDLSAYVKKDELGAFVSVEKFNALLGKIQNIEKVIGGKPNVQSKQST